MARVQEKFHKRVATQVRNKRERFIDRMQQAMAAQNTGQNVLARDDLSQMMEGFVSVVQEALQGRSTELRTFYVETLVPGMLRKGLTPTTLIQTMKTWTEGVKEELQGELKTSPDRTDAMQWMNTFFTEFMKDVERATRTGADSPVTSPVFSAVVAASALSPIIGPGVLRRACEMTGIEAERLTPEQLRDVLPALRKGMSIFLGNPEIDRALKRLETLIPRPVEESPAP